MKHASRALELRKRGRFLAFVVAPLITMTSDSVTATQSTRAEQQGPPPHHEAPSEPVAGKPKTAPASGGVFKPIEIGEGITLQFGGFAKVDFIQDFDPVGNVDQFKVNSIPVAGDPDSARGGNTNISARQTRLSFDIRAEESLGGIHAYVEGDFFGTSNAFRLRHGYGEWKGILGGQTWSTFQDITARPFTLDYEGPDSEIFVRQAMLRYTGTPSERLEWSVAVEDPDSQIALPTGASGGGRNEFSDVPARVRIKTKRGHVQVAGMLRQLRYVSDDGSTEEKTTGYGVNLSGKASVWKKDVVMGHVAFGSGVGRYIESFAGTSSDAVLTPDGELRALSAWAFVLGFTHHWSDRLASTLSGGMTEVDNDPSQASDAIRFARSGHVNLVYAANHLFTLGGELMYGKRENHDGATGDAVRFQFSVQYKFR